MHTLFEEKTVTNQFGVPINTALMQDESTGKYYLKGMKAFGSARLAFDPVDEALIISGVESTDSLLKGPFIETLTALAAANCPRGIVKTYILIHEDTEEKGLTITTDTTGDFLRHGADRLMIVHPSDMKPIELKNTDRKVEVIDLKTTNLPHQYDDALLALLNQTYWDKGDITPDAVKEKVDAASHLFVIKDPESDAPIAMLRAVDNGEFLYVSDSVVDMAHRKRGYATQLMNHLHDIARAAGKPIALVRGNDNGNKPELGNVTEAGLQQFYQRFGYAETGQVLFRYFNGDRVAKNALAYQGAFLSAHDHAPSLRMEAEHTATPVA